MYKKTAFRRCAFSWASLCVALYLAAGASPEADPLRAGFIDPPKPARPSVYWLWLNGYLNRNHVEKELKAFYEKGIRGVLIFDMGARGDAAASPPAGPAFMSRGSATDVAFAVRAAGKLGMDVQLSVASSWDMGGSWVKPEHASMGLFTSEMVVEGPAAFNRKLPLPPLPGKAPRGKDGRPAYLKEVAVLAFPAGRRLPGHDFVFRLDPPGLHTLDHAVLYNTSSGNQKKYGPLHLYVKDFSIAVSTTTPDETDFKEVFRGSLQPKTGPQKFALPSAKTRYVRLRLLNGHNQNFDRLQLGEFQLFNTEGVNIVASHAADRTRNGSVLLRFSSELAHDSVWNAGNIHDGALSGPGGSWSSAGAPPLVIETLDSIIDLTGCLTTDGTLSWDVPEGRWAVMRLVCCNTGERLKVPSPKSDGLATDHLSSEATRVFLRHLIEQLTEALGSGLGNTALKQLYLASYEVRGRIWTPDLPDRFQHYRHYDMTPYLPVLSGKIVVDKERTERFLYDYRKTLGDLLVDAYYRTASNVAHQAGVGIESEAGGPGPPIHQVPVDALKAQGAIDEIRGEFWPKRPDADSLWVIKETACAGHIYGKRRIHMEAFTSMHQWQDGPFDLKPSADRAFCEGANHFVWHTASHLPPEAGKPGWVYHAGTQFNTNLIWWPMAEPFIDYLSRCSFLLQEGLFVADVCYYYGDQGYNFVPPKHVDPSLGSGYDYDVTNREVILTRMSVSDGCITLPDGMRYELLVLPERDDIDLEVLKKIEQFVRKGATVVGPKPVRSNGLTDYPRRDAEVKKLADTLWGSCNGSTVLQHRHGAGTIMWGPPLRDILHVRGRGPDFSFTGSNADAAVDYIHRRTRRADIYFVRNKKARPEMISATFRVHGRIPELWDPATGAMVRCDAFKEKKNGITFPLEFSPYGSVFVVFREKEAALSRSNGNRTPLLRIPADIEPAVTLKGPWTVTFPKDSGALSPIQLDQLISWTGHPSDGIRFFSGTASYQNTFTIPEDKRKEKQRILLDLGELWATAEVLVNSHPMGIVWKPPYVIDITDAVQKKRNSLTIRVANTWSNRLAGDARNPKAKQHTRTNIRASAGRPWKDVPLRKSGLFGPVRLFLHAPDR